MQQPAVTILSFSPIHQDSRVLRQVRYLSKQFALKVIGYGHLETSGDQTAQMFSVPAPGALMGKGRTLILLIVGRALGTWVYEYWYWGRRDHKAALAVMLRNSTSAIHANDWRALPIAVKVSERSGARVVLDLHEYAPRELENRWYWAVLYKPMIDYFLRKYVLRVSASVTVNETIAREYESEYGFRPSVVMNVPECTKPPDFRPTDPRQIQLVHHGMAMPQRKLELMISAVASADERYSLNFILVKSNAAQQRYVSRLQGMAGRLAPGRVFFHEPVAPAEVVERLSTLDMGFYLLPPVTFNDSVALPNKFFDFITAGLGICIGPSPEMARLTKEFGFGVVTSSFEPGEVARILNGLGAADIDEMKMKAIEARKILNAGVEMEKLVALYRDLLGADQRTADGIA